MVLIGFKLIYEVGWVRKQNVKLQMYIGRIKYSMTETEEILRRIIATKELTSWLILFWTTQEENNFRWIFLLLMRV